MIVEFRRRDGKVLKRCWAPAGYDSALDFISIREYPRNDRKEHFPPASTCPTWNPKRKIADLPEPPAELL